MSEVIITVRGESQRRLTPERGVVTVTAAADGPERAAVVERAWALVEPVRSGLATQRTSGLVEDWSTGRVAVWSERPWNNEGAQLPRVHHASIEITATFTDIAALSEWVGEIAAVDGLQVGAVDWNLAPDTRARVEREVATAAVQVAVERATAYAHAIGRTEITPVLIADVGLLGAAGTEEVAQPRMRAAFLSMDAAAPTLAFRPEDIVITAGVEARFRALEK